VNPVFDGDDGETRAVGFAGGGIDAHWPGRAEARTQIVHADDKELVRVQRFGRPDHVVPPADVLGVIGINAGHVMRRVERVTDQHGVGACCVERAVGFDNEIVIAEQTAVLHTQRLGEMQCLGSDDTD